MRNVKQKAFRPGPRGVCEGHLYNFIGYEIVGRPVEDSIKQVVASSMLEAMTFLAKDDPEFRVRIIQDYGSVIMLSGGPYGA